MEEKLIALEKEYERLMARRRAVDHEIDSLSRESAENLFVLQRQKRLSLELRDRIAVIEAQLYPDIIA